MRASPIAASRWGVIGRSSRTNPPRRRGPPGKVFVTLRVTQVRHAERDEYFPLGLVRLESDGEIIMATKMVRREWLRLAILGAFGLTCVVGCGVKRVPVSG